MSYINKPGNDSAKRKMVMRRQISDIFSYGYIVTTKAKAKFSQKNLERVITLSKHGTLADKRRIAELILPTTKYNKKDLLKKIYSEISERYKNRNGGYSRLLKLQKQDWVILSLV